MASSFPNDMFQKVFQRFSYNIDLIEKRYANKRPCGLELDVDTGKIIQVVDAKRPRLTAEEAKEKMKTTFLAPQSLLGNSSLCSPFVNDMTAPRETKRRVLKHNKRFQHQFNNGIDCSTFLYDENGNEATAESNENEEGREEEELFDLDDILDDEDNGEEEDEDDDDDFEEEEVLLEIEDDDDGPSDEPDQDLEDELDNQKESEELPFEEPEEEAEKEDDTYKNMKITRAFIQRLTPKAVRGKNSATKALSKSSKKISPLNESTPKVIPRARTTASALKAQTEFTDSTPKPLRRRNTIGAVPKITRTLSVKEVPKTPTVSKKIAKAASEKAISKKVAVTPHVEDTVKKARGRPRKSIALNETASANDTPIASTGKKNTKTTTEKTTSLNTPMTESTVIKSRGRSTKSIVLNETSPTNITPAASARKNNTKTDLEKSNAKKIPLTESTVIKSRGRPRKSIVLTETASSNVTPLSSVGKKNTKTPSEKATAKKKNVLFNAGDTPKEVTAKKTKKVALQKSTSETSLIEAPEKKARGRPRKSLPAILNVTPLAATSNGKNHKKRI